MQVVGMSGGAAQRRVPRGGPAPLRTGPAATALLPMAGAAVIASTQVDARLRHRPAPRTPIVPGLLLTAVGPAALTGIDANSSYTAQVPPGTLLIGFGTGPAFAPLFATATGENSPQDSGGTSAVILAARNPGGRAAWPLFGTVLASVIPARLSGVQSTPGQLIDAAQAGLPLGQRLPSPSGTPELIDRAVVSGYSATLWWAAGLTLLASLLAAPMIRARTPEL
ncbi:hypothetical protein [Streptomyces sp. NPDC048295]|uniref:hypothetical protein n=1 Tax=Streptomyces sp. NPDC048295 TaxID=3154617 RepID=UPI00344505F5